MKNKKLKIIGLQVDQVLVDRIDTLAVKADISRSKLMMNLLEVGVDYLEFMDDLGVVAVVKVFKDMKENFKKTKKVSYA
jgi:metal-responsive CopG/Arc/MetJ family transcriptional regulator